VKNFFDYVREGIVKKQSPDLERASSLIKETQGAYKFLNEIIEKIGIKEDNANYIIKNSYDIIMELIRAKMIEEGFNSSGKGAHEAEVSYLRSLDFEESTIQFCDQLRYFRNKIVYYGRIMDCEYTKKTIELLEKIYKRII